VPVTEFVREPRAYTMGRSYEAKSPALTFREMQTENSLPVTRTDPAVSFRVVLEWE
jgi:hypothetical protein